MNPDRIESLADYVSLIYHEARNVRHLIRDSHFSPIGWERIISLPTNREEAWKAVQSTRQRAYRASSPKELMGIFMSRFGVDLRELQEMFENPNWRHANSYGGHAWVQIVKDVREFVQAIESGDEERQKDCLRRLKEAEHNTGLVQLKLKRLDSVLP